MRSIMNRVLLLSILPVLIFGCCFSSPSCCQKPYYFADFLLTLKCGISLCKPNEKTFGNLCISCIPRTSGINNGASFNSSEFRILKPTPLCHDLSLKNQTIFGHLILSWAWVETNIYPSIFMLETRNFSKQIGDWDFVGMTNETFADITNLDLEYEYQFRVTPLVPSNDTFFSVLSDWISLSSLDGVLSAPKNVIVGEFHIKENLVAAVVKWNASKEIPCIYKLYWLPVKSGDYFEQRTISLPEDTLSAVLPALSFETNYTITLSAHDLTNSQTIQSAQVWFVTPSCLNLTGGNFSICAPGPPLNVSIQWLASGSEVLLTWLPPKYASAKNNVSQYHISVAEITGVFQNILLYKNNIYVDKNSTSATVSGLKSSTHYVFEIRAVSLGGVGVSAVTELNIRELSVVSLPIPGISYYYYVSAFGVAFTIVVILILIIRRCKRRVKKLGYPSGLADVDDDLRPYLISSDKIELKEIVGQGAFGIVHRGIFSRHKSKDEVAVKVFPSETITRRQLLHEVDVLRLVGHHDYIISLLGFTFDVEKMYLLLEYCPLGNLHAYLVNLKPELMYMKSIPSSERSSTSNDRAYGKRLCTYIYQVAQGMEHISSLKLIHRDIAARNILMQSENRVKIGDFGLSKDIYETKFYTSQIQKKLPVKWMAPESIEKQKFNTFTDVWSFGVLMWEIFKLGKEPYPGLDNCSVLQYLKMGYRLEKPHCSQLWYDIMCSCWRKVPRERPRFKELVDKIAALLECMNLYTVLS